MAATKTATTSIGMKHTTNQPVITCFGMGRMSRAAILFKSVMNIGQQADGQTEFQLTATRSTSSITPPLSRLAMTRIS